jgi:WhiB family redox-sensing transcriptional regulator
VLRQCRNHVLSHRENYGVWGGLTEDQRDRVWTERQERRKLRRAS